MNCWGAIYKFAWGALVVLVIFGVICLFMPRCQRLRKMQETKAFFEEKNRQLENDTKDLKDKQRLFETEPEFVKRVARQTGRVSPDETIYRRITNSTPYTNRYHE